ncbi:hypothetical protein VIGAN_02103500 [Vigna angularis var. angularis]|uniref:Uncharacterized protein n=1 Tax=Vigna angularis var. angularis TaxID=157739 RepID=A0A0S3RCY1_PHAAN|nr:hypothetical protein VIGAN_02103500 [Vigna angularis var. angularis]
MYGMFTLDDMRTRKDEEDEAALSMVGDVDGHMKMIVEDEDEFKAEEEEEQWSFTRIRFQRCEEFLKNPYSVPSG